MIGRTGWIGDLLYSACVSGFFCPIIGHCSWGPDGWLVAQISSNFASPIVVHTIGGVIALVGAIVLGPRLRRVFKRDGGGPMLPHDLVMACVGGLVAITCSKATSLLQGLLL